MHNFRELKIWQRSMELVLEVYNTCLQFPKEEMYGLANQLKRAAVSIPSNISEGSGRNSNAQFKYFLELAMGSANEVQTQIDLASRLGYLKVEESNRLMEETLQIYKMILGFYKSLN